MVVGWIQNSVCVSNIVYVYQTTTPGAQDIDGSDLVIKNANGTDRFHIQTPNEIELNPIWSPNGKMITCETYNTNEIYSRWIRLTF